MPSAPDKNRELSLAPHVRACACKGQVILLDLRRNRYLGVAGASVAALAPVVSGWPGPLEATTAAGVAPADVEALAAPLLRQGLLARNSPPLSAIQTLPEATGSLNAEELIATAPVGAGRLVRFVRSCTSATLRLRLQSLHTIASRVVAARSQATAQGIGPTSQALREAVAAYLRLRPLLLTAHDRCLHDSLSLVGFLAAEGWFPHWVIGVSTQPFAAHAWVQSDDLVLSDLHENVRHYTPILVA